MPTFTQMQVARIRHFLGYSVGYSDVWIALYGGLTNIETNSPADYQVITNAIDGTPPGLLAQLEDIEVQLFKAQSRLKASEVGTIKLNPAEIKQRKQEGRRLAASLSQTVGVAIERDVFGTDASRDATRWVPTVGGRGGNYIGK